MLKAAVLLTISNVFMTFAWYGHLRHLGRALWIVVLVSWGIAFLEYCFQVPANRIGFVAGMSGAQLKTMQEVITLVVFVIFAAWYLNEPIRWNTVAGFAFVALGATLVFAPWSRPAGMEPPSAPPPASLSIEAAP
ncbi:MAG: DMT family protein [Gemmatimonadota bacterium]